MTRMPIKRKYRCQATQSGEAGFTLIEMIIVIVLASILGTFIFGVLTKSLDAQIAMQKRKERADDGVLAVEKISRDLRAANTIITASSDVLKFRRADTGKLVKFTRNTSTNMLKRKSAATESGLSSATGNIVAENVIRFDISEHACSGIGNRIRVDIEFSSGAEWEFNIYPRNYGL